jgi:hypothetical protein
VPDLPIGSISWSLGPKNLEASGQGEYFLNPVIVLSHCYHDVLYFLNTSSVIFRTQLNSISEYCRILNTPHHLRLYWNWLSTLQCSSIGDTNQLDQLGYVK